MVFGTLLIWLHKPIDSIISDQIKRLPQYHKKSVSQTWIVNCLVCYIRSSMAAKNDGLIFYDYKSNTENGISYQRKSIFVAGNLINISLAWLTKITANFSLLSEVRTQRCRVVVCSKVHLKKTLLRCDKIWISIDFLDCHFVCLFCWLETSVIVRPRQQKSLNVMLARNQ